MSNRKATRTKEDRTNTNQLISKLMHRAKMEYSVLEDVFQLNRLYRDEGAVEIDGKKQFDQDNFDESATNSAAIRRECAMLIRQHGIEQCVDLYRRTLLFDAPYDLDCYCRYLEWNRPMRKRFYEPRRKQLLPIVQGMQRLADGKRDLMTISMPPGTGKTTTSLFFLTWLGGKNPELSILGGSHSNSFLRGIYDELLRILDRNGDYLYNDVFPESPVVETNSKDLRIDLKSSKRFETFEFGSLNSGNAGKLRCSRLLYLDDLVDSIETAMSRERMDKLWQQYYTDYQQRKSGSELGACPELHVATRWSIFDPIGRLQQEHENDPRAEFLVFPALDENDQSNFDYPYGLGFSTKTYHDLRDVWDDASFRALYMGEPIEREGRLYDPEELRYFFDLPDKEPDAIVAICDTKEQGADYLSMPIFYQYGDNYYLDTWIFDNGKVEILEQRVALTLTDKQVRVCRIESNRGGTLFAKDVQRLVRELGGVTTITTKWTQTNKEARIQTNSGWVKAHVLFRDKSVSDKEYRSAMKQLIGYTMVGKNKHDDAPDSLALFVEMVASSEMNAVTVMRRPF